LTVIVPDKNRQILNHPNLLGVALVLELSEEIGSAHFPDLVPGCVESRTLNTHREGSTMVDLFETYIYMYIYVYIFVTCTVASQTSLFSIQYCKRARAQTKINDANIVSTRSHASNILHPDTVDTPQTKNAQFPLHT
jgi:hypothetical protein